MARRRQEQQPRLRRVGGEADALVLAKLAVVALQDAKRRDVVELVAAKRGGAQLAHHSRLAVVQVAQPRLEDARRLGPPLPPRRLVEDVARLRDARRAEAAAALRRAAAGSAERRTLASPSQSPQIEQSARRRRVHVVGRRASSSSSTASSAPPSPYRSRQRRRSLSLTAIACSMGPPARRRRRAAVSCSITMQAVGRRRRDRSSRSRAGSRAPSVVCVNERRRRQVDRRLTSSIASGSAVLWSMGQPSAPAPLYLATAARGVRSASLAASSTCAVVRRWRSCRRRRRRRRRRDDDDDDDFTTGRHVRGGLRGRQARHPLVYSTMAALRILRMRVRRPSRALPPPIPPSLHFRRRPR